MVAAVHDALDRLDPAFPEVDPDNEKHLEAARAELIGGRPDDL
jgi:hypothetical protein